MKNKLYSIIGILGLLLLILLSIVISNIELENGSNNNDNSLLKEISIDQYFELIEEDENTYIFVGSPSCPHCVNIKPHLIEITKELNIEITYLNLNTFSQDDYNRFIESNDILKEDWGTPLLLIFNNGKLKDYFMGYDNYETIKAFYLKNKN